MLWITDNILKNPKTWRLISIFVFSEVPKDSCTCGFRNQLIPTNLSSVSSARLSIRFHKWSNTTPATSYQFVAPSICAYCSLLLSNSYKNVGIIYVLTFWPHKCLPEHLCYLFNVGDSSVNAAFKVFRVNHGRQSLRIFRCSDSFSVKLSDKLCSRCSRKWQCDLMDCQSNYVRVFSDWSIRKPRVRFWVSSIFKPKIT